MLIRLSLHELFGEASQMLHELIDIQAGAGTCETPAQKWPPLLESKVNIRYSVRLTRSESKACLLKDTGAATAKLRSTGFLSR
jgi:hypothetical protein